MKEVSFKTNENSKGRTRVRGIRVDRGSILDDWWEETTHASSIVREVMTAFILNQYIPQSEQQQPNKTLAKINKIAQPKNKMSEDDLQDKIDDFLGDL